jgi:hypothetical protein
MSAPFKAAGLDVEPVHPVTAPVGSVNPIPPKWALGEFAYCAGVNIMAPPPFCKRRLERDWLRLWLLLRRLLPRLFCFLECVIFSEKCIIKIDLYYYYIIFFSFGWVLKIFLNYHYIQ